MLGAVFEFLGQMFCLIFGLSVSLKMAEGFGEGVADAHDHNNSPAASIRSEVARVIDSPLRVVKESTRGLAKKAFSRKEGEGQDVEELERRLGDLGLSEDQIQEIVDSIGDADVVTVEDHREEEQPKKKKGKGKKKVTARK